MLTVRNLVQELGLSVHAGEDGLDLPVRWVHISELPDPTPWLSGGELLLTTGMQLDGAERQREFVERLAEHQLAGVGIGTGFRHQTVPEALVETAAERGFPVFEIPYEVPFIAITEAAFTRLVNEQYAVLRRAIAAHERLERIVLSQRGLEALAAALASLIGGAVLVMGARGEPWVQRTFRRSLARDATTALTQELRERTTRGEPRPFVPSSAIHENRGIALPVTADGRAGAGGAAPEAWLVALKDGGPLSDFDRLTLRQAVTIVALELLRDRVAGETERRLAGDVLAAMASGELGGRELERRLEPFGLDREVATIVAGPDRDRDRLQTIRSALAGALREESVPAVVATTSSLVCALIAGMPESDLFTLAGRLSARLPGAVGGPVRVAVGRTVASGQARRSFHEARCALEAVSLGLNGGGKSNGARTAQAVASYRDLGSFQLLLSLQDDEALRLFCDSILGPIEASEGRYGGELMRSLEAFIECNGQWERAARRLYCHRHTLRYRIRRIESLTGRSLQSARDRIEFWLALRGRELIGDPERV
ncbi:MAG: PucR family transcriptional regulator ligand-binding domain-containing protein [Solirubrobacterales bacterium]|nr:PucR family transcriptional regulator ligand-binding domain-containing protein [Solirubrobacterales bacterium]MBV9534909.1 PucR family transcriptional regulator ligand-binding domain-containing protein [Solirubrobacterales bacterium]